MSTEIKGYYDNGQIILMEEPPENIKPNVIVTFFSDEESQPAPKKITLGNLKGLIEISDDFNDPLDDLKDYM